MSAVATDTADTALQVIEARMGSEIDAGRRIVSTIRGFDRLLRIVKSHLAAAYQNIHENGAPRIVGTSAWSHRWCDRLAGRPVRAGGLGIQLAGARQRVASMAQDGRVDRSRLWSGCNFAVAAGGCAYRRRYLRRAPPGFSHMCRARSAHWSLRLHSRSVRMESTPR
jgi:hypothetical protein